MINAAFSYMKFQAQLFIKLKRKGAEQINDAVGGGRLVEEEAFQEADPRGPCQHAIILRSKTKSPQGARRVAPPADISGTHAILILDKETRGS